MDRPILDSLGGISVSRSWTLRAHGIQHRSAMDTPDNRLNHDAFGTRDRGPNRLYVDWRYFDRTTNSVIGGLMMMAGAMHVTLQGKSKFEGESVS